MMHVKVKAKNVRFSIPIPYAILNVVISIMCSKFFCQHIYKWTKVHFDRKNIDFPFPRIDKKTLKPIIKELENYKGMVLVDVQADDGTKVKIRL